MKLLQMHKDAIKRKVVSEKFDPKFAALDAKEWEFANRLLDAVPRVAELGQLPDGWVPVSVSIKAYFGGWSAYPKLGVERRVPYFVNNKGLSFSEEATETAEWRALVHERGLLESDKRELVSEIDKVLRSVSTDKRLLEIWPEVGEVYLPKVMTQVPATVNIDKLKSMLLK